MKKINFLWIIILLVSCEPRVDYGLDGELPSAPDFTIVEVEDMSNTFVVESQIEGAFNHVWDFPGGNPSSSTLTSDTIVYNKKGMYEITLHIAASDGNGTSYNTKSLEVLEDIAGCPLPFLPEDCSTRCWRLAETEGAIKVGPVPYSGEWFVSSTLEDTQLNDQWCFDEAGTLTYINNGGSFSACQGYVDDPEYPIPPDLAFEFSGGSGFEGQDEIIVGSEFWMGVEDSGPNYGIVSIDDEKMVVLTPIKPCDGSASPGWFTIEFFAVQ